MTLPIPDYICEQIEALVQGSQRAYAACVEFWGKFPNDGLRLIEESGLRGAEIYYFYFNHCRGDLDMMKAELDLTNR